MVVRKIPRIGDQASHAARKTVTCKPMAYKDSLFRSIFGNEKSALALYNAVSGASLDPAEAEVVISTLTETLWTPRKNDLSFTVNGSLVVIAEHQSSANENMPYRMLQYVCRLFENGVADQRAVYRRSLVRHPRPRFVVFFNGPEAFPDRKKMLLSESYGPPVGDFDRAALELEVDVYNVNDGRNSDIIEACEELKGYAFFVSRARVAERELSARADGLGRKDVTLKAMRQAIRDCKSADLLREFWEKMTQEEINMLASEWNMETALEVEREEGLERGLEKGREEKGVEIARNALAKGLPFELICDITGLDMETIAGLQAGA